VKPLDTPKTEESKETSEEVKQVEPPKTEAKSD